MNSQINLRWFTYQQNNSGGSFNKDSAVDRNVFVQAPSADEANEIAVKIGIYFDGCSRGIDCSCCGDRWRSVFTEEDGDPVPSLYGSPVWKDREMSRFYAFGSVTPMTDIDSVRMLLDLPAPE
tara:strand:- start:2273 stop:2641 length:369 start_codon:yes stop_codon:yes gene_type:complete